MLLLASVAIVQLSLFAGMRAELAALFVYALALSGLLAMVPLALLWFLDRRERETPWLFAAAFLWGGCIATGISLPFNTAFYHFVDAWVAQNPALTEVFGPDVVMMIVAPVSAPIVEEIAKAVGVLLLFYLLRAEFDNMRDGLVYGALVGVGFNWFETALYVVKGYAEHGQAALGLTLGLRYALFGLGGHALFTGIFGAFLGFALQTRRRWLRVLAPIVGLLLAIAAHMINNALPLIGAIAGAGAGRPPPGRQPLPDIGFLDAFAAGSIIQLAIFVPFLLIMGFALWRSGVWERRVIREELAAEVGRTVSAQEYGAIVRDRILRTRRIDRMHPRASAALVNAQHELAFRKRRVREGGGDPEQDPLVAGWREDIARLRAVA
jgi:RsiW-degrading membrane proteinase PrsW (M82 family)